MVASCTFDEFNQAGSVRTASISNVNVGGSDYANLVTATWPITAGSYSFEKLIKVNVGGTFNYVGSMFFWISGTTRTWAVGEDWYCTGSQTTAPKYSGTAIGSQPAVWASLQATWKVWSGADPCGSCTVPFNGVASTATTGSLASAGSSDFIVVQLQTTTSTPPGNLAQKTWKLQWTEA